MGLTQDEIPGYWAKRGARYAKEGGWGPGAMTPEQHSAQVEERAAFIFEECPCDVRTLDYGCGIGMYSKYFEPDKYLGLDIAEPHLEIARATNPDYKYGHIASPTFAEALDWQWDVFFTATVLQHCSDAVIEGLLTNVATKHPGPFLFSIYEYANQDWTSRQTMGRTADDYIEMVDWHFRVVKATTRSHLIHGTTCAHTMIDVEAIGD